MKACVACNRGVAKTAKQCPYCGKSPNSISRMVLIGLVALVIVVLLGIVMFMSRSPL